MTPDTEALRELSWIAASAALIAGYQLWLWWRARRDPAYSVHAVNCTARRAWVKLIMADAALDILGIQTLRNSVMATSLRLACESAAALPGAAAGPVPGGVILKAGTVLQLG